MFHERQETTPATRKSQNPSNGGDEFEVVLIPPTEDGLDLFLTEYKRFRLLSLQLDPTAFSSSYAREAAFDDSVWKDRLRNPRAKTFVARGRSGDNRVLSSLTLVRESARDHALDASERRPQDGQQDSQQDRITNVRHWEVNAVWTLPAARRRGLARAVLDAAIGFLRQEDDATVSGGEGSSVQEWLVSVGVHEDNMAARSLYEKCGFTVVPSSVSPARDEEASVGRDRVAASLTSKPIRMELRLASAA